MPIPYDEIGNRGENVVRIKVKTRNALENIVPFIDACNAQGLLTRVSCPISTKKGRQHIRGFLAYLECADSSAVQQLFSEYNEEFACFKPLDVNPPQQTPIQPCCNCWSYGQLNVDICLYPLPIVPGSRLATVGWVRRQFFVFMVFLCILLYKKDKWNVTYWKSLLVFEFE
jgi:hypothetical protein